MPRSSLCRKRKKDSKRSSSQTLNSSSDSESDGAATAFNRRQSVSASVAPAEAIRDMRVEKSTVKNYKGKINRIKLFFLSVDDPIVLDRALDEAGELIAPLCEEDIKRVFSWLSTDTDLPKRRKLRFVTEALPLSRQNWYQ